MKRVPSPLWQFILAGHHLLRGFNPLSQQRLRTVGPSEPPVDPLPTGIFPVRQEFVLFGARQVIKRLAVGRADVHRRLIDEALLGPPDHRTAVVGAIQYRPGQ